MSASFTINSCQKICVVIPTTGCGFLPITWGTPSPNIVTVNSSGSSAIITPNIDAIGVTTILVTDPSGTTFNIFVTITSGFNLILNPKYQYIYTTNALTNFPATVTSLNFNGPFNPLIAPFQPNIVTFIAPTNTGFSLTDISLVSTSIFLPSSASPSVRSTGSFRGSYNVNLVLFGRTLNINSDSILLFADIITCSLSSTTPTGYGVYNFLTQLTPLCSSNDYISLVQTSSSIVGNNRVITSQFFPNSNLQFTSLSTTPTINVSAIIIPKSFYDITSPSLVFSKVITGIPIVTTGNTIITVITPNIPVGSVCWFAQQYFITDNATNVLGTSHVSSTSVTVAFSNAQSFNFTASVVVVAYQRQSNVGFTIT